jgi:hypothetical protein
MTRKAVVAILLVLLSGVAWAEGEEKSFETRWHEAYVLEVIEGKVPEAARMYLDLIEEPELPKHLMRECRFRFAVCAALLGRTDEARSILAGLATDEAAPADFKARVIEYHEELGSASVGSALDKRLEALVYEVGRVPQNYKAVPPQYRDFQIIGKPAVPTLVRLLKHRDATLRSHAYRILCRMDEPIVVTLLPDPNTSGWADLRRYLQRNPGMAARVEPGLLEIMSRVPAHRIGRHVSDSGFWQLPSWRMPFIESMAACEGYEQITHQVLLAQTWTEYTRKTVGGWIENGRPSLAGTAAQLWLERVNSGGEDGHVAPLLDEDLFPVLVRRVRALNHWPNASNGLTRYARAMPADLVHSVLEDIAKTAQKDKVPSTWRLVLGGLEPLEKRADPVAFERVVRLGMEKGLNPSTATIRFLFARLPLDEGRAFVKDVMKFSGGQRISSAFAHGTERDVEMFLAALSNMPESWRNSQVQNYIIAGKNPEVPDAVRHALARALPRLWRLQLGDARRNMVFMYWIGALTRGLPDEEIRGILIEMAAVVPDISESWRGPLINTLLTGRQSDMTTEGKVRFNREIRARVLPEVAKATGALRHVVDCAIQVMVDKHNGGWNLGPGGHDPILGFLAKNLTVFANAGNKGLTVLIGHPDHFPLVDWVPLTGNTAVHTVGADRADAAADALTADPAKVNYRVLSFLRSAPSDAVKTRVFDRLLSLDDAGFVARVQSHTGPTGLPASPAALEKAMKTLTADEDTPLATIAALGKRIAKRNPTPALFPLVNRLIGSDERARVLEGIAIAQSLCSRELVPALIVKLDSLDSLIREAARKAIDAIFEIDRIKEEARKRLGDR